ncbi:pyridoxamine 5'-phosphate oxidase family protein [Mycobacterium sp.]|uniref:pyridoxamine 5'-phosphate oxidase family protein n=1 Tax=Mycobacterium sp. TaxID=1785 RepID=UPI003F9B9841
MIRLTEDEAWAEIAATHTGILTTLRRDGMPIALPVWFVAEDRTVAMTTPAGTKKIARVRHDPRASFLVESGQRWVDVCAVHLTGRVEFVTDEPAILRIEEAVDAKYAAFRPPAAGLPAATQKRRKATSQLRLSAVRARGQDPDVGQRPDRGAAFVTLTLPNCLL